MDVLLYEINYIIIILLLITSVLVHVFNLSDLFIVVHVTDPVW